MSCRRAILSASAALTFAFSANLLEASEALPQGGRLSQDLSGEWDAISTNALDFELPAPAEGWKKEQIPAPSSKFVETSGGPYMPSPGELLEADGKSFKLKSKLGAWFRTRFNVDAKALEGRIPVLRFNGAAFKTTVWLNGKPLGSSVMAAAPFEFQVADALKAGENELLVGVAGREALVDIPGKTYVSPSNGVCAGIRERVEILYLPPVHIDNVFIKTSVAKGLFEVEAETKNQSAEAKAASLRTTIYQDFAPRGPIARFNSQNGTVPARSTETLKLAEKWVAPELWEPDSPVVYRAHVELVSKDGQTLDAVDVDFGYREFAIKGKDFTLNGKKFILFRNSTLASQGAIPKEGIFGRSPTTTGVCNTIRLHLGFSNLRQLDNADRTGLMTIPEASWSWVNRFPSDQKGKWLENTLAYYDAWIKLHRNRPSVVMWSLCNETYWDNRRPEDLAIAKIIFDKVSQLDPTRPVQGDGEASWNGLLPTINIHYPEGTAGVLNQSYPNTGLAVPSDLRWLSDKGENTTPWRAKFVWDRPLMLGEYWCIDGSPDTLSSFMGDSAYDWTRWRWQDIGGRDIQEGNLYIETLNKASDIYRMQGVACLNPWSGDRNATLKPVTVRPADFHPNFVSGKEGVRKLYVFKNDLKSYDSFHLQCRLEIAGKDVWEKKLPIKNEEAQLVDLAIPLPEVQEQTEAKLTVRLRFWRAGGNHELARWEETLFIIPKAKLSETAEKSVALYDPAGKTAKALADAGLPLRKVDSLSSASLKGVAGLAIGEDALAGAALDELRSFVENGGRALILQQKSWRAFAPEVPEADAEHAATQAWIKAENDPLLKGFKEAQFSFWRPDDIVSVRSFWKPSAGDMKIALDCGGRFGMRWTPLMKARAGKGEYVFCSLSLVSKLGQEPFAATLLARLIDCAAAPLAPRAPLNLLAGANAKLKTAVEASGCVVSEGAGQSGPLLADASTLSDAKNVEELKKAVAAGRPVWLHGAGPDNADALSKILPFKAEFEKPDKIVQSCVVLEGGQATAGLSNFDFYWTRVDLGARDGFFQNGKATAKLGDWILKAPSPDAAAKLVEPGFLQAVKGVKGPLLIDTLAWEGAGNSEADKAGRVVSTLLTNLGAELRLKPEPVYNYFHLDLKPFVNMGYYDKVAGDGKGGWTDQGKNDMRFFLINHTAKMGGLDDAPDITVEKFPTRPKLGKRPYELIDPKANDEKAVVSFQASDKCKFLPAEVKGIKVGAKADVLWFLHAATWANSVEVDAKIAQYTVNYEDGTSVVAPVRCGMEVGDWWNPSPLSNAEVAWTGRNLMAAPIGIWAMEWRNPNPEKTIKSIDAKAGFTIAQLVLLAITGGTEAKTEEAPPLASWDLGALKNGAVADSAGGVSLQVAQGAKTPEASENPRGLLFEGGAYLSSNMVELPWLNETESFKLSATFRPDALPSGYCGGVFQAMTYQKGGFRMTLGRDMRLSVEAFPGEGRKSCLLTSKAKLEFGRVYSATLRQSAGKLTLLLDGRPEDSKDCVIAAPGKISISVGRASGKDYFFNGVIGKIEARKVRSSL